MFIPKKTNKNSTEEEQDAELLQYYKDLYIKERKLTGKTFENVKPAFDYEHLNNKFDNVNNFADPLMHNLRIKLLDLTENNKDECTIALDRTSFIQITHIYGEDQTLIVINDEGRLYTISWYKSRSHTELFTDLVTAEQITLREFIDLYQRIVEETHPQII
jgi:hypothetical protein